MTVRVFDVLGREVARPLDGARLVAGAHAAPLDGARLPAGVYLYRVEAGGSSDTGALTRVR